MKPKERFLLNIQNKVQEFQSKIQEYQRIYDFNKDLPEEFFENLSEPSAVQITEEGVLAAKELIKATNEQTSDYGLNRRLVVQILNNEGKAMRKVSIATEFLKLNNNYKNEEEAMTAVTNVLTALKNENAIIGYKPENAKFRGLYWGLSSWFDGDKPKKEFQPEPIKILSNYLVVS